jgi:hypothetical protein
MSERGTADALMVIFGLRRVEPERDARYRAWIKTLACVCCGRMPCDPAHTGTDGGMGQKASDYSCVPLCRTCHDVYHSKDGERGRALWLRYGVNLKARIRRYRERYEREVLALRRNRS